MAQSSGHRAQGKTNSLNILPDEPVQKFDLVIVLMVLKE